MLNSDKGGDKNSLIGMIIISLLFAVMMFMNSDEEQQTNDAEAAKTEILSDSFKEKQDDNTPVEASFAEVDTNGVPVKKENETFTLENDKVKIEFESLGARVVSAYIKDYKKYDKTPLNLIHGEKSNFDLVFAKEGRKVHTNRLIFDVKQDKTEDGQALTFSHRDAKGGVIKFKYVLKNDSYELDFDVKSKNLENQLGVDPKLKMAMNIVVPRQEKNISNERNLTTLFYNDTEEVDNLSEASDDEEIIEKAKWFAFKGQFFSTVLTSEKVLTDLDMKTVRQPDSDEEYVKNLSVETSMKIKDEIDLDFKLYFLPNNFKQLKSYEQDFQYLIPLGWGIFGWINRFVVIEIFHFLEGFDLNYGLVIFIMALVIKLVLFPLTKKSYTSMAAMRVLKPQLDEIKEKHPDDPMKQQQEQMALYGKAGVSPLSGCLPMLAQMPILFALFRFFPASIELRQQSFLWADDLSTFDNILNLGFEIPFYGAHVSLFALLMAGSSFIQMIYNNQNNASAGDNPMAKQMKYMMYFMPIIFLGVMNSYAAALSYYYFIANMMTFAQQYWIRKKTDDKAILAKLEAKQKDPKNQGGNRFQRRMEEMMKQQQQMKK